MGERLLIGMGQPDLPGGGGSLFFLEPQPPSREAEMTAADRNRSGRDEDHLLAARAAAGDVAGECREPRAVDLAALGDQERRADLDDQPACAGKRVSRSHGAAARDLVSAPASFLPARVAARAANTASSAPGTPAPVAPDRGSTGVSCPVARRSPPSFRRAVPGSSASILLSPTISGLPAMP